MRYLLESLAGIALLTLSIGCGTGLSSSTNIPRATATAAAANTPVGTPALPTQTRPNETATISPAGTSTPEGELTPSETATTSATREAISCSGPASQLVVDYLNSPVLARRVPYSLYLPPCYGTDPNRRYPVLYLLHGANTDHTQWPDLNVQLDADLLIDQGAIPPLIVVMPGGEYQQAEDYGSFVLRDLIPHIEGSLQVASDGKDRAIGGLSQGGYWALDLALAHPELFTAVGGHSPSTDSALTDLLAPIRISELRTLRIYLDVGDADPLAPGVGALAGALQARGLVPIFHIYPGAHNRPYWRSHTREYLMFYAAGW